MLCASGGQDHAQNGISSSAALCKVDMSKETSQTDDRTVRKGMMVAEKALNSVKAGISLDSTLCEGRKHFGCCILLTSLLAFHQFPEMLKLNLLFRM